MTSALLILLAKASPQASPEAEREEIAKLQGKGVDTGGVHNWAPQYSQTL